MLIWVALVSLSGIFQMQGGKSALERGGLSENSAFARLRIGLCKNRGFAVLVRSLYRGNKVLNGLVLRLFWL
jgi:hypothetical protein